MSTSLRFTKTTLIAAMAALGLAACTELSAEDRSLLNRAVSDAAEAKDGAQEAAAAAKEAARAAESAQRAAEEAAQLAREANERSERMFNESLRKR